MESKLKQSAKGWLEKTAALRKRFKYPALVLLFGLLLLLIPGKKQDTSASEAPVETPVLQPAASDSAENYRKATETELAAILSQIDGAGSVRVMLTLKTGHATQYQTDYENSRQTGDTDSMSFRQSTVILQRSGAYDEAAVVKTEYPQFQGALIVSEGADHPVVRLALENAVAALLGLGTDKITVVKMK